MRTFKKFCLLLTSLFAVVFQAFGGVNAGTALNFDGINDYVTFPAINLGTNALTIEAWVKPSDLTNSAYSEIIRQQSAGTVDWFLAFQTNGTVLTFGLRAGGNFQQLWVPISATNFTDGNWHHIAATYDGAVTRLFSDGHQLTSLPQIGATVSSSATTGAIGASFNGNASEFFNGAIDEVRVWNVARTLAEIKSYMSQSLAGNETGLAAYWRLDEGSGSLAADASGDGHNGTLFNGPQWIPSTAPIGVPFVTTSPASNIDTNQASFNGQVNANGLDTAFYFEYGTTTNYGNVTPAISAGNASNSIPVSSLVTNLLPATAYHYRAVATNAIGLYAAQDQLFFTLGPNEGFALSFDGINDYLSSAAVNLTDSPALTLEAWIKPANITGSTFSEIIRQQGPGTTDWLVAFQTNGTLLTFGLNTDSGNYQELRVPINPADFTDGYWHHIAATYDGVTKSLYKDGVLIGSAPQYGVVTSTGNALSVGASLNGTIPSECFSGQIDEVRIWRIARSTAQINQNLNTGLIGSDADLVAYWHFDEGLGTTTIDDSSHGYTASLVNGPAWVASTSPVLPFTAPPLPASSFVTHVTTNTALLNSFVNADGLSTTVYFEYGVTTNYGNQLASTNIGSQLSTVLATVPISNLLPATAYHWRVVASNTAGTNYGLDHILFTSGPGPGSSLKLSGSNQAITAQPVDLTIGLGLSVEAWIKPVNITNTIFSEIIRQEGPSTPDFLLSFQNNGSVLSFGINAAANYQELHVPVDPAYFTDGSWHHVAASYDGVGKKLYVDGLLIGWGSDRQPGQVQSTGTGLSIGATTGIDECFNGWIDEVRVWNAQRTASQLNQFMNSGLTGSEPGLVAYWRFDEGSGTTTLDFTGKGNTGMLRNSPLWAAPDVPLIPTNGPPLVSGGSASNITSNSATLAGNTHPNGLSTLVYFQYGATTNYGLTSPDTTLAAGLTFVPVGIPISSLESARLYNYRLVASNSLGITFGPNKILATPGTGAGYALSFDGVDDYIVIPPVNLSARSALTIEAWVQPVSLSADYCEIIRQSGFSVNDWLLAFQNNGSFLSFGLTTTLAGYQELRVPINPSYFTGSGWHHIAATYDGSVKRLYVDGIQVGSTNQLGSITFSGSDHTIGSSGGTSEFFNGLIDEVRFWNIARSSDQIIQTMNQNLTGAEPGLIRYWRFDEGNGTTADDSTFTGANGTLINGPVWVSSTAPVNTYDGPPSIIRNFTPAVTPGSATLATTVLPGGVGASVYFEYGFTTNYGSRTLPSPLPATLSAISVTNTLTGLSSQKLYHWRAVATNSAGMNYSSDRTFVPSDPASGWALSFNGVNNYLSLPVINLSSQAGLTMEAWIKPSNLTTNQYSDIIRQTGQLEPDWMLAFQAHGSTLSFGLKTTVSGYQELRAPVTPATFTDGNWHHIAAVYDGSEKRIYVDGIIIGSASQSGNVGFASTAQTIGASLQAGPAEFFNGAMDEIRIWNTGRTADQLDDYMNQSLSGTEAGLVGYWRFNEGTGVVAGDSTPKGRNGSLVNGPVWVASTVPVIPFNGPPAVTRVFTSASAPTFANLVEVVMPGALGAQVQLQYGLTTNYGNQLPLINIDPGSSGVALTNLLTGLLPQNIYHWRLIATNDAGMTVSSDRVFVTADTNFNSALKFDGLNDSVSTPAINFSATNQLTIEAWVLPFDIATSANSEIIRQQGFATDPDYLLSFQNYGLILSFGLGAGGQYLELHASVDPAVLSDGNWHHIAAVYDGAMKTLFLDGVAIGASAQTGNIGWAGTTNFIGSAGGGSEFFNGVIDDVRLWSVARTPGEINQNLNRVLVGMQPGLEAYWRFDDLKGNTARDSSGKSRNGTLNNGPDWFSPGAPLLVIAPPAITNITALAGKTGASIVLQGINLLTTTNVTLNGTTAGFSVNSDSSITVTIPAGATTGPFLVQTHYGEAVSANNFAVDNSPPLISFQYPLNGTFVSGFSQITGQVSDISGAQSMTLYIQRASDAKFWNGSSWGLPTPLPVTFSGGVWSKFGPMPDGLLLPDGSYTLFISATDRAGNSNDITSRVTVNKAGAVPPVTRLSNGHLLVRFPGAAGQSYRLEVSTDLLSWTTLTTITVDSSGILSYEDTAADSTPIRFFRTVTP